MIPATLALTTAKLHSESLLTIEFNSTVSRVGRGKSLWNTALHTCYIGNKCSICRGLPPPSSLFLWMNKGGEEKIIPLECGGPAGNKCCFPKD